MDTELESTPLFTDLSAFEDSLDVVELRAERKARVIAAMHEADLDALMLGREANVRYVSGAEREWMAASRPFAPTCIVTRDGSIHIMAFHAGTAGIAAELPMSNVFTNTFNPLVFVSTAHAIPGVATAKRIGVDGFTPMWFGLVAQIAPGAKIVGAQVALAEVRATKTDAEIHCLRRAIAIAEGSLTEASLSLADGVSELSVQGAFRARMSQLGTTQFGQAGSFTVVDEDAPLRWISTERLLADGDLVMLYGGVQWLGYEGSVGRTWWCGRNSSPDDRHHELYRRWNTAMQAMIDACRVGASTHAILQAHETSGVTVPEMTICYSVGLGAERSLVQLGSVLPPVELRSGMVLGLRTIATGPGGGYFGEELVLVRDTGPEVLTTLGHGPLAAAG